MSRLETIYLKQKVLSIREKFTFYDRNQKIIYKARGNLIALPKRYQLFDKKNTPKVEIVRAIFSFMPQFELYDVSTNHKICTIRKKFRIGRPILDMATPHGNYIIDGNIFAHDFRVYNHQNKQVINVQKQWISWGDAYEITVDTMQMPLHVAASIVIAIDCTYHNQRS